MKKSFWIAWGMLVFLMLFNSNSYAQNVGQASGSGNVLGLKVPKVEKFVRVTKEEGADMVKAPNEKKLSPAVVKTEGRYKGLVIDVGSDEEWGEEWLDVGVLADGMIVSPESYVVVLVHDYEMGDVKEMKCVFDKKTSNVVMRYPDSMYMENEDGMGRWFDPAKLTDAQIEQMLQTLSLKKRARRVRCDCLIPEGNGERNVYYLKY